MKSLLFALLIIFTAPAYARVTNEYCADFTTEAACEAVEGCVFNEGGIGGGECTVCTPGQYYKDGECENCPWYTDAALSNKSGAVGVLECYTTVPCYIYFKNACPDQKFVFDHTYCADSITATHSGDSQWNLTNCVIGENNDINCVFATTTTDSKTFAAFIDGGCSSAYVGRKGGSSTDKKWYTAAPNGYYGTASISGTFSPCPAGTTTSDGGAEKISDCHTTSKTRFVDSAGNSFSIEDIFGKGVTLHVVHNVTQ